MDDALKAQFDTAETSLNAAKTADASAADANAALASAQASADAAGADALAKHQQANSDALAFLGGVKAHFGL